MNIFRYSLVVAGLMILIACGGEKKKEDSDDIKLGTKKESVSKDTNSVNIGLTGNDLMQYDKTELKVKAGQEVTLTFRHVGKMELKVMGHNFVLLKPGVVIPEFALKAAEAGETSDWIPEAGADVIVHTKMIGGGQSTSITFTAPEAGTYDYICSFPGHSGLMKGKFIVE